MSGSCCPNVLLTTFDVRAHGEVTAALLVDNSVLYATASDTCIHCRQNDGISRPTNIPKVLRGHTFPIVAIYNVSSTFVLSISSGNEAILWKCDPGSNKVLATNLISNRPKDLITAHSFSQPNLLVAFLSGEVILIRNVGMASDGRSPPSSCSSVFMPAPDRIMNKLYASVATLPCPGTVAVLNKNDDIGTLLCFSCAGRYLRCRICNHLLDEKKYTVQEIPLPFVASAILPLLSASLLIFGSFTGKLAIFGLDNNRVVHKPLLLLDLDCGTIRTFFLCSCSKTLVVVTDTGSLVLLDMAILMKAISGANGKSDEDIVSAHSADTVKTVILDIAVDKLLVKRTPKYGRFISANNSFVPCSVCTVDIFCSDSIIAI